MVSIRKFEKKDKNKKKSCIISDQTVRRILSQPIITFLFQNASKNKKKRADFTHQNDNKLYQNINLKE